MIARAFPYIIIVALLADAYLHVRYIRKARWWWQALWWLPTAALTAAACWLRRDADFVPRDMTWLNTFLMCYLLTVTPKGLLSVGDAAGLIAGRLWRRGHTVCLGMGAAAAVASAAAVCHGFFVGFHQFEVVRVELTFKDLPKDFDGYRIVQWSDAHVGTLTGSRSAILQRAVDSINAQHADIVVFTGDMQNKEASEIVDCQDILKGIKARDGVISVLGNYDYPIYIDTTAIDEYERYLCLGRTVEAQTNMGWKVLMNSHVNIKRDSAHIVIAGMENDGEGRFPQLGNVANALRRVKRSAFVIMVEHDPTSWRRKILPHSHCQLTLSGHTHAGQLSLMGWHPSRLRYREDDGLYSMGERRLLVTHGLGGVVPFRLGATGEIVEITLRKSH